MKQPPVNLNAAINLLNTISQSTFVAQIRQASLFMQLCHHWQMATLVEVNWRSVARREK